MAKILYFLCLTISVLIGHVLCDLDELKLTSSDLKPAPSERFLDLSYLFGKTPVSYPSRPYYPNQGGYYPTNGYNPQSGYNPFSSGYPVGGGYPQSGYYPPTYGTGYGNYPSSGYYPGGGSNVLGGGASGYGGYGGFGGNGGLSSYYGYNTNIYDGNRNLGYGYYRGTNPNGLIKSDYITPNSLTGYRGYN